MTCFSYHISIGERKEDIRFGHLSDTPLFHAQNPSFGPSFKGHELHFTAKCAKWKEATLRGEFMSLLRKLGLKVIVHSKRQRIDRNKRASLIACGKRALILINLSPYQSPVWTGQGRLEA